MFTASDGQSGREGLRVCDVAVGNRDRESLRSANGLERETYRVLTLYAVANPLIAMAASLLH